MKKIKYYYNTHTLRYEKVETPLRVKLLRVFGFIAAALVTGIVQVKVLARPEPPGVTVIAFPRVGIVNPVQVPDFIIEPTEIVAVAVN